MSRSFSLPGNRKSAIVRAAFAVGSLGILSAAGAQTWNDNAAVNPTISGNTTNFLSTVALKDGDVLKNSAVSAQGLNANLYYYVVGVGSTPSTTLQLSTAPGGSGLVTPGSGATLANTNLLADWNNPTNWSGSIVPNSISASAVITTNANTPGIAFTKDTTIGNLTFSGGQRLNLVSTIVGNAGPLATLTFAKTVGTPTITVSGGQNLSFSDTTPVYNPAIANARMVIAGTQGLTIDNQNPIAALPTPSTATLADSASAGAVKFGFLLDWSKFKGTMTLAEGAFAPGSGGSNNGYGVLPQNVTIVLGTGTSRAQWEMNQNGRDTYMRGLNGNAQSDVINSSNAGGPALTLGSYRVPGDAYSFAGTLGAVPAAELPTPPSGQTAVLPDRMRIIKIGASSQELTGPMTMNANQLLIVNGGTLSLGKTGTVGTVSGPGQATSNELITVSGTTVTRVTRQQVILHNGEFRMEGTAANPRSQAFLKDPSITSTDSGVLVQNFAVDGAPAANTNISQNANGFNTITLVADPAQPISLSFSRQTERNLSTALLNANANGRTTLYRGTNLGTAAPGTAGVASILFGTNTNPTVNPTIVTGTAGTTNMGVLKGALADTNAAGTGAGFATYDVTNGVRLLAANDQDTTGYPVANAVVNTRLNLAGATAITGVQTQTLQLDNTSGSPVTVTNTGTALNFTGGALISGSSAVTLTGGQITGTAATDSEDVVISNINTAGATLAIDISNPGVASRPGWITLNGPGNYNVASGTYTMGNSGGIAFNGTGTTTFNGSINSATQLALNQGTLIAGPSMAITSSSKPRLNVAAGTTLDLNGNTSVTFDAINTNLLPNSTGPNLAGGIITNTGSAVTLLENGSTSTAGVFPGSITGNLSLKISRTGSSKIQTLIGPNTYTGGTTVTDANTLAIGRYGSLPIGTTVTLGESTTNTAGVLQLGDSVQGTLNGAVNQEVAGLVTAGNSTASAVVGGNGAVSVLTVNLASGTNTFAGMFGGAAANQNNLAIHKSGAGTLILNGANANSYFGGTVIDGGVLSIDNDAKLGRPASLVGGGPPIAPQSVVNNNVVINNATLQIVPPSSTIVALGGKRGVGIGSLTGAVGATATIDTPAALTTSEIDGPIGSAGNTGTNNLTKTGIGKLTLGNPGDPNTFVPPLLVTETYNGHTNVLNGALEVYGSIVNNGSNRVHVAADPDGTFGTADDISIFRTTPGTYVGMGSSEIGNLALTADIRQGANTSGADIGVKMQWRGRAVNETNGSQPPLPAGANHLISDVVNVSGMDNAGLNAPGQTDPYALQMTYDPSLTTSEYFDSTTGGLYMGWLDTTSTPQWKNAVAGDIGPAGGGAVSDFQGSYATFALANSVNDGNISNFLGSWGVDIGTKTVWAIVDHNSQFSVVETPEPSSLALLAIGAGAMLRRRNRRA